MLDNIVEIQALNEKCNRYGIDTIETGAVIAFSMECYENNLLNRNDIDSLKLNWGDAESMLNVVDQIVFKQGFGKTLSRGLIKASEEIGPKSKKYAIHCKGLSFAAHDPRGYNSVGLAYATNSRGACHLQAYSNVFERTVTMPDIGINQIPDRFSKEGKAELVAKLQDLMCIYDSATICKFSLFGGIKIADLVNWLNFVTDLEFDNNKLIETGERIFNTKRIINNQLGITKMDDKLPERILKEPKTETPAAGNLPPIEKMIKEYYDFRGWNMNGKPKMRTLKRLNINFPPTKKL